MRIALDDGAFEPEKAHKEDAGFDLKAKENATLFPGDTKVFDTGVHMEIPVGYCGFVCNKSGLSVNHGIESVFGVVDSGYTGSIRVKLRNTGYGVYEVKAGDKISQIVICHISTEPLVKVERLEDTERGEGGFGSTGR